MTSEERREKRYKRRLLKRQLKKITYANKYNNPKEVFSTAAIVNGFKKTSKESSWKASTKRYKSDLLVNARKDSKALLSHTWKPKKPNEFNIVERGHPRHIQSVHISDKAVQAALSNECLVPIITKYLIYDNGASIKNKGTKFANKRFEEHLKWHFDRFGLSGGIFFFDFSSYFEHIKHDKIIDMITDVVRNDHILEVFKRIITSLQTGDEGLGLGSQVFQISAVFYPNSIDHFMKDTLGIHCYGRFMDDGYIILPSMEELRKVQSAFESLCAKNGIIPNKKKCKIIRFDKKFSFLKIKYFITKTGKIVKRLNPKSSTKERRRIRAMRRHVDAGIITFNKAKLDFYSWLCSKINVSDFWYSCKIIKYFNKVFSSIGTFTIKFKPKPTGKRKRIHDLRYAIKRANQIA